MVNYMPWDLVIVRVRTISEVGMGWEDPKGGRLDG